MAEWTPVSTPAELGPSLAAQLLHSTNLLWGGTLIFLLTGLGPCAVALLARTNPDRVMLGGCLALTAGAVVTAVSIQIGAPAVMSPAPRPPGWASGRRSPAPITPPPRWPSGGRAGLITALAVVIEPPLAFLLLDAARRLIRLSALVAVSDRMATCTCRAVAIPVVGENAGEKAGARGEPVPLGRRR